MPEPRPTLLVVDDDFDVRDALRDALEDEGYRVALAEGGEEALGWLKRNPAPAAIVLDWVMPKMSGASLRAELARERRWAKIPLLVLTADRRAVDSLPSRGLAAALRKPVKLDELLAALEACRLPPRAPARRPAP